MAAFRVREATEDDCEDILELIRELAVYSKLPESFVKLTPTGLKKDGFGPTPWFHVFVAELISGSAEGKRPLVGYVLYYYSYDPFLGPTCFMEHLLVTRHWRKRGIGSALLAALTERALFRGCVKLNWMVFNWNQPSIHFYKDKGAQDLTKKDGLLTFAFDCATMQRFVPHALSAAVSDTE